MKTTLAFVLVLSLQFARAQSSEAVFIYMAHGPGIEVGTIEENVPGNYLLLRTPLGQLKRIRYSEIDSIAFKEVQAGLPGADTGLPSAASGHSPLLAGVCSALIPGAGQIYNGDYDKAFRYPLSMIGFGAVGALGGLLMVVNVHEGLLAYGTGSTNVGAVALFVVGSVGVLTMYVLGIIDAVESAARLQRKARFLASSAPLPEPGYAPSLVTASGQPLSLQISIPF